MLVPHPRALSPPSPEGKAFGIAASRYGSQKRRRRGRADFAPAKRWAAGVKNRFFANHNIIGKSILFERSEFLLFLILN